MLLGGEPLSGCKDAVYSVNMNNFALITLNITLVLLLHVLLHVFSRSSYIQQPHTYATLLHNLIFMKLLDSLSHSLSLSFSLVAKVFPSYLLSIFDFLRTFSCWPLSFHLPSTLIISLFLSNFSISGPKNPWGFQSNLLYISVFSLLFFVIILKKIWFLVSSNSLCGRFQ